MEVGALTGFHSLDDQFDTAEAERNNLYNLLLGRKGARACITRKILDSRQLAAIPTGDTPQFSGSRHFLRHALQSSYERNPGKSPTRKRGAVNLSQTLCITL